MLQLTIDKTLNGQKVSFEEARQIYTDVKMPLGDLLQAANRIREHFKERRVELCSIVNAKSGNCSEDCKFCSQSLHHSSNIEKYPLIDEKQILKAAKSAKGNGATCFGIVTSGKGVASKREIAVICRAIGSIKEEIPDMKCSVSLGTLDKRSLLKLKKTGIAKIHHNLETSEDYFPKMCTTHTYKDRLRVLKDAKELGFKLCSGGIFGLGERREDRLKLAFTLRDLDVDSVPLNFLHPVKGTPLENKEPLSADEILRIVAIYRIILPDKDIKVCGGRVVNLGDHQRMIFEAGANGMMIGNYLTQPGRAPSEDLKMLQKLGLHT